MLRECIDLFRWYATDEYVHHHLGYRQAFKVLLQSRVDMTHAVVAVSFEQAHPLVNGRVDDAASLDGVVGGNFDQDGLAFIVCDRSIFVADSLWVFRVIGVMAEAKSGQITYAKPFEENADRDRQSSWKCCLGKL